MNNKFFNRNDIILLFILGLSGLFFIAFMPNLKKNSVVEVYKNNKLYGEYPLAGRQIISIDNDIIEIKDGSYRMLKCKCPNQLCVKQGWQKNQPVICVPQKIVIKPQDDLLITR